MTVIEIKSALLTDLQKVKGKIRLSEIRIDKMKPYEMLLDSEMELKKLQDMFVQSSHVTMGTCAWCETGLREAFGYDEPVFVLEENILKEVDYSFFSPAYGECTSCGAV